MKYAKRAFSIAELAVCLLVMSILFAASFVGYNRIVLNNRIDVTESELRNFAAAWKTYNIDYGAANIKNDSDYETNVNKVIDIMNSYYLESVKIELLETASDKKSFTVVTKDKNDAWSHPYKFRVYTYDGADAESICGLVIAYSAGADGIYSEEIYKDGNYGDDIIAIVKPN